MAGRGKPGSRAEVDELRLRMELLDAPVDVIAAEIGRRFGYRPRQSYRLARGWEQREAAQRYNALVQVKGVEHAGRDSMTPSRVSEFERWPHTSRKPGVYVLLMLAEVYGTAVATLLDAADLAALDAVERAALIGRAAPAPSLSSRPSTVIVVDGDTDSAAALRKRRRAALLDDPTIRFDAEQFAAEAADQSQTSGSRVKIAVEVVRLF